MAKSRGKGHYLCTDTPVFYRSQSPATGTIPADMASGTVKFFNTEKGFGFITPDEGGKDVFVHKTGTRTHLNEGDKVSYEVEQSPKGPNAVNVQKA
jgi:CspA family cold shock protein